LNKIKLDIQKQDELIKDIKEFIFKETNVKFSKNQASNLLNSILNEVEDTFYNQTLLQTRYEIMQEVEKILGIEKGPLH
jgi:uncharacterized protein (DUF2164 family)